MSIRSGLFLVVVLVAFVVAEEAEKPISEEKIAAVKKCMSETKTTKDNISAFVNKETYPENMKCFIKCLLTTKKALKEDGTFDIETMVKHAGEERRQSIAKCTAQAKSADLCAKAEEYETCFRDDQTEFFQNNLKRLIAVL